MSQSNLGLIGFSKPKTRDIPQSKRCSICKKRAHHRIRPRNIDTNEPLDQWTYYCNRHFKQAIEKIQKQATKHNLELLTKC